MWVATLHSLNTSLVSGVHSRKIPRSIRLGSSVVAVWTSEVSPPPATSKGNMPTPCSPRQGRPHGGPARWRAWLLSEVAGCSFPAGKTLPVESLQGRLKELLRAEVFWCYQEGLIIQGGGNQFRLTLMGWGVKLHCSPVTKRI